jgi:hypothetical protein
MLATQLALTRLWVAQRFQRCEPDLFHHAL